MACVCLLVWCGWRNQLKGWPDGPARGRPSPHSHQTGYVRPAVYRVSRGESIAPVYEVIENPALFSARIFREVINSIFFMPSLCSVRLMLNTKQKKLLPYSVINAQLDYEHSG